MNDLTVWRTKCEHGQWEPHDEWMKTTHPDYCPGGVAMATLCGTCNGCGLAFTRSEAPATYAMNRQADLPPCPNCVEGWVLADGWEWVQWCETHESEMQTRSLCSNAYIADLGGFAHAYSEPCVFVWRPIGPAKETI